MNIKRLDDIGDQRLESALLVELLGPTPLVSGAP